MTVESVDTNVSETLNVCRWTMMMNQASLCIGTLAAAWWTQRWSSVTQTVLPAGQRVCQRRSTCSPLLGVGDLQGRVGRVSSGKQEMSLRKRRRRCCMGPSTSSCCSFQLRCAWQLSWPPSALSASTAPVTPICAFVCPSNFCFVLYPYIFVKTFWIQFMFQNNKCTSVTSLKKIFFNHVTSF